MKCSKCDNPAFVLGLCALCYKVATDAPVYRKPNKEVVEECVRYAVSLLLDPWCIYSIHRAWRRSLAAESLDYFDPPPEIMDQLEAAENKREALLDEAPWLRPHNLEEW